MNLLIVDDEQRTRDCLKKLVCWGDIGITRVRAAANGMDALEMANAAAPDILLTDIRMPRMDGIALSERVRELYPACKIIFLSGYSDKEYLKSAIHLKAVTYIEKPIKLEEVRSAAMKAAELANEEKRSAARREKLERSLEENRHLFMQELALALVKPCGEGGAAQATLRERGKGKALLPACALMNWSPETGEMERIPVKQAILKGLAGLKTESAELLAAGFLDDGTLVLAALQDMRLRPSPQFELFEKVLNNLVCFSQGRYLPSIGVGEPCGDGSLAHASFRQACLAARMQFFRGVGRVFHAPAGVRTPADTQSLYREFHTALANGGRSALSHLAGMTGIFRSSECCEGIESMRNVYYNILLTVNALLLENRLQDQNETTEKGRIWEEIERIPTLQGLHDRISGALDAYFARLEEGEFDDYKINRIVQYIRDNYWDNDLTVQAVADSVPLSLNYMCALFKKSTGKTINNYITEYRIKKAKELLRNPGLKLYDIATRVGFANTQYLSGLFRKHEGISTSEFRKKHCQ